MVIQPDGKIVVGGATQSGATTAFAVLRYLPDGRPDADFGSGGLALTDFDPAANDGVTALSLLPDGRILAAGAAGDAVGLARYRPDGAARPHLRPGQGRHRQDGPGAPQRLEPDRRPRREAARRRPGRHVRRPLRFRGGPLLPGRRAGLDLRRTGASWPPISGRPANGRPGWPPGRTAPSWSPALPARPSPCSRYLPDGRLDPAFGAAGVSKAGPDLGGAHALAQLPDGRLILAGERLTGDFREVAVARYRPDGAIDSSFGTGGVVGTDVGPGHNDGAATALYPGGRLVVAGTTLDENNVNPSVFLLRYTAVDE